MTGNQWLGFAISLGLVGMAAWAGLLIGFAAKRFVFSIFRKEGDQ